MRCEKVLKRDKNNYHPLVQVLFKSDLLAYEFAQTIPRSTRNYWLSNNYENTFGHEHCTLYHKEITNLSRAQRFAFLRYLATFFHQTFRKLIDIFEASERYTKTMRKHFSQVDIIVQNLLHKGFTLKRTCRILRISPQWFHYHKRKIICPKSLLKKCFKQTSNQLSYAEQNQITRWINLPQNIGKSLVHLYYEAMNKHIFYCALPTFACMHTPQGT